MADTYHIGLCAACSVLGPFGAGVCGGSKCNNHEE